MTTTECPRCEGTGTVYLGDTSKKWGRDWVPDDDWAECQECNGDGFIPCDADYEFDRLDEALRRLKMGREDIGKMLAKGDKS